jgi:holo-[acyl-carrier protein] synthase
MIALPEIPAGTNVVGVGIDSIEVVRIKDSIEKHGDHFLNKIFTSGEQAYCKDKSDPAPFYATRFASKEAIAKALRTVMGKDFGWLDSEIIHGSAGEPFVALSEQGEELLRSSGATKVLVSLTHLEAVASAVVVLVSR